MPPRKPILAYHVVFGAYGFWLPNDPRGSWSEEVWAEHLQAFGPASKVSTRHSLAKNRHDVALRRQAKQALDFPPVRFTGIQAREIARGFANAVQVLQVSVLAAAIMPDHVHMVIAQCGQKMETIAGGLKRFASRALTAANCHPLAEYTDENARTPSAWCRGVWKVYLHDEHEITRAIAYVRNNPLAAGFRPQHWSFVTPQH